ncbi:MAG: endonuclease/exonuclease/phosphatase, partial [Candidatus Hydrogenedentes bacterium]|nr:endonuclease/exonuclease/phosphatase [Candidatus Hydrogenedentota bacterium]
TLAILLADTGLTNALPEADYAEGRAALHNTFSSENPAAPIDHIFYNSHIERVTVRALQDAGTGSDHFPVLMTFSIKKE